MPQEFSHMFLSPEFAENVRKRSKARAHEDYAASRVWTVASSELGEGDETLTGHIDSASIDFSEVIDERAADRLQSLGESLLDLTMAPSDNDADQAMKHEGRNVEERLESMQNELVDEVIDEAGISAAKENYEAFEKETDADGV